MPSVFGYIPSGSRCGNVPNELVHRAGPPFLDNHYRGYQYFRVYLTIDLHVYSKLVNAINATLIEHWIIKAQAQIL